MPKLLGVIGGYHANAVNFDGVNDYLTRGGQLDGLLDGKVGTISLWFNVLGSDGLGGVFMQNHPTTPHFNFLRNTIDKIQFALANTGGATLWNVSTTASYTTLVNTGWHHLMIAWDLAATFGEVFIDGADAAVTEATSPINQTADYTKGFWSFGGGPSGAGKWDGDIADVWMDLTVSLDPNTAANLAKFYANGRPVPLGATGQLPTGSAPILCLTNETDNWHTNIGDGGGMTENGALTTASSSPSG